MEMGRYHKPPPGEKACCAAYAPSTSYLGQDTTVALLVTRSEYCWEDMPLELFGFSLLLSY